MFVVEANHLLEPLDDGGGRSCRPVHAVSFESQFGPRSQKASGLLGLVAHDPKSW